MAILSINDVLACGKANKKMKSKKSQSYEPTLQMQGCQSPVDEGAGLLRHSLQKPATPEPSFLSAPGGIWGR